MVGLIPLFAVELLSRETLERLPEEPAATDQGPVRPVDRGPEAEAVLSLQGDAALEVAEGLVSRPRARGEETHHLGVTVQFKEQLSVRIPKLAEIHPLSFKECGGNAHAERFLMAVKISAITSAFGFAPRLPLP